MKKKLFILCFITCYTIAAMAQAKITGSLEGNVKLDKALLKVSYGSFPVVVDSVKISNGKFTFKITDSVMKRQPDYAAVSVIDSFGKKYELRCRNFMDSKRQVTGFYLSDTIIHINGVYNAAIKSFTCDVSKTTDNIVYYERFVPKYLRVDSARETAYDSVLRYVKKYSGSQCLIKAIYHAKATMNTEQLKKMIYSFKPTALKTTEGQKLVNYLKNVITEQEHLPFTNLLLRDRNGSNKWLIDSLKDANLIIFWTSWCIPCRQEIPLLKRIYDTLTARGASFQFISVSVDEDKSKWLKADSIVALPWKSLWEPDAEKIKTAYNYDLPSNFLIPKNKKLYKIDAREQDGINAIWKAARLPLEILDFLEKEQSNKSNPGEISH